MAAVIAQHHVKIQAAGAPELHGLFPAHDEQGGGKGVAHSAVVAHHGGGQKTAAGHIAGFGVNNMIIGYAIALKIALVAAGGDDEAILQRQHAEVCRRVVGILYGHAPERAVALGAAHINVAAQADHGG